MALVLNEEQTMLQDAARTFLAERAPVSHLRALRDEGSESGYSPELWADMAEMGWPAILIPEAFGGLDYGHVGLGIVLQETGRTLTPSPLLSSALGGATAITLAGSASQKSDLLPGIASGERITAVAVDEGTRHRGLHIACSATPNGDGYTLSGTKRAVIDGHVADTLIVAARVSGEAGDADGIGLFLVDRGAAGVDVSTWPALDTHVLADVYLNDVEVGADAVLGEAGAGGATLERTLDAMRIGQSAELLGVALEAFERTLDYLKDRKQFGVPIGSFQGLQHRAAQLFAELELCKSVVLKALQTLDETDSDIALLASATKAKLSQVAHLVCIEAVQMHGGIGMTDEFDIGFFLKRCQILETLLGDGNYHLDRWASLKGY